MEPNNKKQNLREPDQEADSLRELSHTELSGTDQDDEEAALDYSETDDDEDEGVGNGTMGRSLGEEEE
jgi:hypothetical protein